MAKNQTETIEQPEMENGINGRKKYALTEKAKTTKFVTTVFNQQFKNSVATFFVIDIDGYKKQCKTEPDEKSFVLLTKSGKSVVLNAQSNFIWR